MNRHTDKLAAKEQIDSALSAYRESVTRIAPSDWQAIEARLNSTVSAPVARRKPVLPSLIPFAVTTAAFALGAYVAHPPSTAGGADRPLDWSANRAEVQSPPIASAAQFPPEITPAPLSKRAEQNTLAVMTNDPQERSRRRSEPVGVVNHEEPAAQNADYSEPGDSGSAASPETSTHYVIGAVPASMSGSDSTTANLSEEQRIW